MAQLQCQLLELAQTAEVPGDLQATQSADHAVKYQLTLWVQSRPSVSVCLVRIQDSEHLRE